MPTPIQRVASVFNTTTSPKTATLTAVSAGDVIVIKAVNANATAAPQFGTPTGLTGSPTVTSRVSIGTTNSNCRVAIWTVVATSSQANAVISVAQTGTAADYGIEVVQYPSTCAVGANVWSAQTTATGTPSASASTTVAHSVIEYASTDWAALTGSPTYLTATAGTFTQTVAATVSGQYTYYLGRYADSGTVGSKTIGMSAPTGQTWTLGGVEIVDSGGTSTPITLSTSSTTSAIIARGISRSALASSTVAGAIVRLAGKPLGSNATVAATATRTASKPVAASSTAAAAVAKLITKPLVAGSTVTALVAAIKVLLKSLTTSSTTSATISRTTAKVLAGAATAAPTITRRAAKTLQAATTGAATAAKTAAKPLAAGTAVTATVATMKVLLKAIAATSTTTAALTRAAAKQLASTVAAAPVLARRAAKTLQAAPTVTPAVTKRISRRLQTTSSVLGTFTAGASGVITAIARLLLRQRRRTDLTVRDIHRTRLTTSDRSTVKLTLNDEPAQR